MRSSVAAAVCVTQLSSVPRASTQKHPTPSTAQHSTAQHSTAQHSTAVDRTHLCPALCGHIPQPHVVQQPTRARPPKHHRQVLPAPVIAVVEHHGRVVGAGWGEGGGGVGGLELLPLPGLFLYWGISGGLSQPFLTVWGMSICLEEC